MITGAKVRRGGLVVLTVLVVAAASALWHHLPTYSDIHGPFDINGAGDDQLVGRNLTLTVTGVRSGLRVKAPPRRPIRAAGVWVVVDAEVAATADFAIPEAQLVVGPNTYIPSDRFFVTQLGGELAPGIRQRGSWVFDVAPAILRTGVPSSLRVSVAGDTARLDSRLVVSLPHVPPVGEDPVVIKSVQATA